MILYMFCMIIITSDKFNVGYKLERRQEVVDFEVKILILFVN